LSKLMRLQTNMQVDWEKFTDIMIIEVKFAIFTAKFPEYKAFDSVKYSLRIEATIAIGIGSLS